jgi:DNA-binding response OmpR family regulator
VEDSDDDAFFFARRLKKTTHVCDLRHVLNGAKAIELFSCKTEEAFLPQIVFIDLKMPIVSGFDLLEWMNAAKLPAGIDVYVLSGSNDTKDRSRASLLGATGYLVKPVSTADLEAHIKLVCSLEPSREASTA